MSGNPAHSFKSSIRENQAIRRTQRSSLNPVAHQILVRDGTDINIQFDILTSKQEQAAIWSNLRTPKNSSSTTAPASNGAAMYLAVELAARPQAETKVNMSHGLFSLLA